MKQRELVLTLGIEGDVTDERLVAEVARHMLSLTMRVRGQQVRVMTALAERSRTP